jgi:hypothetical protein
MLNKEQDMWLYNTENCKMKGKTNERTQIIQTIEPGFFLSKFCKLATEPDSRPVNVSRIRFDLHVPFWYSGHELRLLE